MKEQLVKSYLLFERRRKSLLLNKQHSFDKSYDYHRFTYLVILSFSVVHYLKFRVLKLVKLLHIFFLGLFYLLLC